MLLRAAGFVLLSWILGSERSLNGNPDLKTALWRLSVPVSQKSCVVSFVSVLVCELWSAIRSWGEKLFMVDKNIALFWVTSDFFCDVPAVYDWLCPLWASVSSLISLWKFILKSWLSGFFFFFFGFFFFLFFFYVGILVIIFLGFFSAWFCVASFLNCDSASSKLKYNRYLQMMNLNICIHRDYVW